VWLRARKLGILEENFAQHCMYGWGKEVLDNVSTIQHLNMEEFLGYCAIAVLFLLLTPFLVISQMENYFAIKWSYILFVPGTLLQFICLTLIGVASSMATWYILQVRRKALPLLLKFTISIGPLFSYVLLGMRIDGDQELLVPNAYWNAWILFIPIWVVDGIITRDFVMPGGPYATATIRANWGSWCFFHYLLCSKIHQLHHYSISSSEFLQIDFFTFFSLIFLVGWLRSLVWLQEFFNFKETPLYHVRKCFYKR
jgi:hypothetical protein